MGKLEAKLWRGEPIKAELQLGDSTYTVYTDSAYDNSGNFIKQINFSLTEGNDKVNPLGISSSNSITITIYDINDYLSPANTSSPYYGKTVNGVKIQLYISYDGLTWTPYGTYYATYWGGEYYDGGHGLVSINGDDKLNTLGNLDIPELEAYSNVEIAYLIKSVLNGIGIDDSGYTIDPSLNMTMQYGIVAGSKVRDFLNNVCQLMLARVVIDRDDIIRFIPALNIYSDYNEIDIGADYTGSFTNKNNTNINYNKVSIKYLEAGETFREQLFSDNSQILSDGENKITDISFKLRALSIEQVRVLFEETENSAYINSIKFKGYQNGIELDINVVNGPINNCIIYGEGITVSTTEKTLSASVDNTSVIGGSTFEFDTKQMMNKSDALNILNNLQTYISKIGRNVIMSGTALTPKLYTGDKINIADTGTMYDGSYKISKLDISFGEDYSLSATMIRL